MSMKYVCSDMSISFFYKLFPVFFNPSVYRKIPAY
jgi:hypothetical protein